MEKLRLTEICTVSIFFIIIGLIQAVPSPVSVSLKLSGKNISSKSDAPEVCNKIGIDVYTYQYKGVVNKTLSVEHFGRTERYYEIPNGALAEKNIEWDDAIPVCLTPGIGQTLRLHLNYGYYECRGQESWVPMEHDIGHVDIAVDSFLGTTGAAYTAELSDGGVIHVTKTTPIKFKLSASNIPRMDTYWGWGTGKSDTYAEVFYQLRGLVVYPKRFTGYLTREHKTSTIDDSSDPAWPDELVFYEYQKGFGQRLVIKLYDADDQLFSGSDDFIGQVDVPLDDLKADSNSNTFLIQPNKKAKLTVHLL